MGYLRCISCREGTEKPPQWTKKRVETTYPTEEPPKKHNVQIPKPVPKPKVVAKSKTQDRPDSRLKDLETLHQKANVNASIRLPEGCRIKIAEPARIFKDDKAKQHKSVPKFDPAFADLKQGELKVTTFDCSILEPSDDELPDAREVLAAYTQPQKESSSDTGYTNSEFDDLVRDIPWDTTVDVLQDSGTLVQEAMDLSPVTSPEKGLRRKRQREITTNHPSKRVQRSDPVNNSTSSRGEKQAADLHNVCHSIFCTVLVT